MTMLITLLAWRPFLDPLPLHDVWMVLLIPLAAAMAVVYKALKLEDLTQLPREAGRLTGLIVASMIAAAAVLWALTEMV